LDRLLTWPLVKNRMNVFRKLVGEHVSRKPRGESFGVCFFEASDQTS